MVIQSKTVLSLPAVYSNGNTPPFNYIFAIDPKTGKQTVISKPCPAYYYGRPALERAKEWWAEKFSWLYKKFKPGP